MCHEFGAKPENLFERRCQIVRVLRRKRPKSAVSAYVLGPLRGDGFGVAENLGSLAIGVGRLGESFFTNR